MVFGKGAEFAEKYFHKGMRVGVSGRIQTGSYRKADGTVVYTTDVIADEQEFLESKGESREENKTEDDFMSIPDDMEGLPFN